MKKKIEKIYNFLKKRLPQKYCSPIKLFPNTKSLLKYYANNRGQTYKQTITYYNKYLQNPRTATYTRTKYCFQRPKFALQICALSGYPIFISCGRLKKVKATVYQIMFILLHEIGHNVLKIPTEKNSDLFAFRWIRKLKKENLICEE